jgi:hypothetical protein
MAVRRHLTRVAERLPAVPAGLAPTTDASDADILRPWQAVQMVIDLGVAACDRWQLGAPASYADAFRRLAGAGIVDSSLAERLARAAGFRNVVAHACDDLEMARYSARPANGRGISRASSPCWPTACRARRAPRRAAA